MNDGMHDVRPDSYATVIREMIRHENDVTNHRIMWLLVGQGLIANAYLISAREQVSGGAIAFVGMLVAMSAFVMLYKSYQARGYLLYLGKQAKAGKLPGKYLPLDGWPQSRIKDWRREDWCCPWLLQAGHLLEPWLFLPALLLFLWLSVLLMRWLLVEALTSVGLAIGFLAVVLPAFCVVWVWFQRKNEVERTEQVFPASTDGDRK